MDPITVVVGTLLGGYLIEVGKKLVSKDVESRENEDKADTGKEDQDQDKWRGW